MKWRHNIFGLLFKKVINKKKRVGKKMAKNDYEEIDIQNYFDGVKPKKLSWKSFTTVMK